jgi:hypothetical protein
MPSGGYAGSYTATVAEISAGGLLLLTPQDRAPHERLMVRIALPITRRLVTLTAEVRWVSPNRQLSDGARPVGLQLHDVPATVLEEIESYVELMNDWADYNPSSGDRQDRSAALGNGGPGRANR